MKRAAMLREADARSARAADVAFRGAIPGRQRAPYLAHAMPVQPPQATVRRAELLRALNLPANARIQFGGREWLQDFDDASCLIVTVPR